MRSQDMQIVTGITAYQMAMTYSDAIETFCSLKKISTDQFFQEAINQRLQEQIVAPIKRVIHKIDDILDPTTRASLRAKAQRYSAVARVMIDLASQRPDGWSSTRDELKKYLGVGHTALKGILFVLRQNHMISLTETSKSITVKLLPMEETFIDYLQMFKLA